MDWVPHSLNTQTDFLSRIVDYDDWGMDSCIFQAINASWGPHSVELLPHPTMLFHPAFHSMFWSLGCEAVDTFTVNWGNELNWWVPHLHLICWTIHHASQCRAL